MDRITVSTSQKRQIVDITDEVTDRLPRKGSGVATIFVAHTTAAITTADLDPGTDFDFLSFMDVLTPQLNWQHPHDPNHAPDHLWASLIGPSVAIPYKSGRLLLGVWQRVVLVDLDGPRTRDIVISYTKIPLIQ